VVYEVRETPTTLGGALNITCNGLRVLDKLGVYKQLEGVCAETPEFEMYNANGSRIGLLKSGILTKEKTGYGTMRVMRTIIRDILLKRLEEEGIMVKNGMHLTKVEETSDSVEVTFVDGTTDTADLLIGADGIHSAVRSLHVDPEFEPEYTGLSSLYSIIPIDILTSPVYFSGNFGAVMFRKGMFGTGFCDKERTTMYWFNSHTVSAKGRDGWIAHGKELENIRSQLMESAGEIRVPLVHEILEKSSEIRFYPIYRLPLNGKWFTQRTLLIGDAGHGTFPLWPGLTCSSTPTCRSRHVDGDGGRISTLSFVTTGRRPSDCVSEVRGDSSSKSCGDLEVVESGWEPAEGNWAVETVD